MPGLRTYSFDTTVVKEVSETSVAILGSEPIPAHNVQVEGFPSWVEMNGHEHYFGVYFGVVGKTHYYEVELFEGQATIEVYTVPTGTYLTDNLNLLSTMRPANQDELELALRTILADAAILQPA